MTRGGHMQEGDAEMVIKRIAPVSCAKIAGTLYVILGFVFGAVVSLIALAGGFANRPTGAGVFGMAIGAAAVIVIPIVYGCMGFVATLIGAWLYNLAAGLVGGIEIETQ
jgi:hypothetical protein